MSNFPQAKYPAKFMNNDVNVPIENIKDE